MMRMMEREMMLVMKMEMTKPHISGVSYLIMEFTNFFWGVLIDDGSGSNLCVLEVSPNVSWRLLKYVFPLFLSTIKS